MVRPYYSSNSQALSLFVSSAFYYKAAFGRTHLTPEPMFTFAFQIGKFGNTFFHSMSSNFSFYFRTWKIAPSLFPCLAGSKGLIEQGVYYNTTHFIVKKNRQPCVIHSISDNNLPVFLPRWGLKKSLFLLRTTGLPHNYIYCLSKEKGAIRLRRRAPFDCAQDGSKGGELALSLSKG